MGEGKRCRASKRVWRNSSRKGGGGKPFPDAETQEGPGNAVLGVRDASERGHIKSQRRGRDLSKRGPRNSRTSPREKTTGEYLEKKQKTHCPPRGPRLNGPRWQGPKGPTCPAGKTGVVATKYLHTSMCSARKAKDDNAVVGKRSASSKGGKEGKG